MIDRRIYLPPYGMTDGVMVLRWFHTVVQFGANAAGYVSFAFTPPDDYTGFWTGIISLQAVWSTPAAGGNMYWRLHAYWGAAGENIVLGNETPAYGVTANLGTDLFNIQEPANPLTLAGANVGDIMTLYFDRDGTDALDTINDVVYVHGLILTYKAQRVYTHRLI